MNVARKLFVGLTGAFLLLLPLQFLFAGYGVFSGEYGAHEAFGAGLLHLVTVLMFITALVARNWRAAWLSLAVVVVIFLQIFLVDIGRDADQPWVSALHPFLAFCYWPFVYLLIWRPLRAGADAAPARA